MEEVKTLGSFLQLRFETIMGMGRSQCQHKDWIYEKGRSMKSYALQIKSNANGLSLQSWHSVTSAKRSKLGHSRGYSAQFKKILSKLESRKFFCPPLGFQPDLSFGNLWDLFKRIFTLWKGINVCQENEYKIWRKIICINIGGLEMEENTGQILVSSIGRRVVMIGCETSCD